MRRHYASVFTGLSLRLDRRHAAPLPDETVAADAYGDVLSVILEQI